jgi:endonuclease YncB( thermonuclease family)
MLHRTSGKTDYGLYKGKRTVVTIAVTVDGDTFKTDDGLRIRLYGADAPETHPKEQSFGKEATEFAEALFRENGNRATLEVMGTDRYQRTLGKLTVGPIDGRKDVGTELLRNGLAWAYRKYLPEGETRDAYLKAEEEAREKRAGLWSEDGAVEPEAFRRRAKEEARLERVGAAGEFRKEEEIALPPRAPRRTFWSDVKDFLPDFP